MEYDFFSVLKTCYFTQKLGTKFLTFVTSINLIYLNTEMYNILIFKQQVIIRAIDF